VADTKSTKPELPRSPGDAGSRGSRGEPNRGAAAGEGTHEGRDAQLPDEGKEDLRSDRDAQGGGGISSGSSRSKNL
jgi:hypothetical protein